MNVQTMYPAMVNSPVTELAAAIDNAQTTIEVVDGAALPPAPNLATLGSGENAETILYNGVEGNTLTGVTRGFQGTPKAWAAGTKVARLFTAYDHEAFRANIIDHETRIEQNTSAVQQAQQTAQQVQQALAAHLNEKATLTQYGHVQHGVITAMIPASDWEGDEAPFTNTVSVPGILMTDSPIVDVVDETGTKQNAWSLIYRAVTSDGSITFYATEKPEIDLPVQIKVCR